MKLTDATESKCCCNCKHNIRKEDNEGEIYCECEIDKHYIGYVACFCCSCDKWKGEVKE